MVFFTPVHHLKNAFLIAVIKKKSLKDLPHRKEKKGNQYFIFYDLPIILAELSNIPNLISKTSESTVEHTPAYIVKEQNWLYFFVNICFNSNCFTYAIDNPLKTPAFEESPCTDHETEVV